jgi:hypothetical protein
MLAYVPGARFVYNINKQKQNKTKQNINLPQKPVVGNKNFLVGL